MTYVHHLIKASIFTLIIWSCGGLLAGLYNNDLFSSFRFLYQEIGTLLLFFFLLCQILLFSTASYIHERFIKWG